MNSQTPCPCGRTHHDSKELARQAANRMRVRQAGKYETRPCLLTPGAWVFVPTTRTRAHRTRMAPQRAREARMAA